MKQKTDKKITILAVFWLTIIFSLSFSFPALGNSSNSDILWGDQETKDYIKQNSGLPADSSANDPRIIVVNIIRFILGFLGILAVIMVLYAGFKWMFSRGNEDQIGDAKKTLVAALIGLVIILFSYALVEFVVRNLYEVATDQ